MRFTSAGHVTVAGRGPASQCQNLAQQPISLDQWQRTLHRAEGPDTHRHNKWKFILHPYWWVCAVGTHSLQFSLLRAFMSSHPATRARKQCPTTRRLAAGRRWLFPDMLIFSCPRMCRNKAGPKFPFVRTFSAPLNLAPLHFSWSYFVHNLERDDYNPRIESLILLNSPASFSNRLGDAHCSAPPRPPTKNSTCSIPLPAWVWIVSATVLCRPFDPARRAAANFSSPDSRREASRAAIYAAAGPMAVLCATARLGILWHYHDARREK